MSVTLTSRERGVKIFFGFFWGDFCHSRVYLRLPMRLEIAEPPRPGGARIDRFPEGRFPTVRANRKQVCERWSDAPSRRAPASCLS